MNWIILGLIIVTIYIGVDIYFNRKKMSYNNFSSKVIESLNKQKPIDWIIGFVLAWLVMFIAHGITVLNYEAQTCEISPVEGTIFPSEVQDQVVIISNFENGRSWLYYLRKLKEENNGKKPINMNIICEWDLKNTINNIKKEWNER